MRIIKSRFIKLNVILMLLIIFTSLNSRNPVQDNPSKDRKDIPEKYKWNLGDLYADDAAWYSDKANFAQKFQKVIAFKGRLGNSAVEFRDGLDFIFSVKKDLTRLYVYASLKSDQDTRESEPLKMFQEAGQLFTDFSTAASYVEPEILAIGSDKLEMFFKEEKKLEEYRQYIRNIERKRNHTFTEPEEKMIAKATLMMGNSYNIYSIFSNAEMPRAEITLSTGEKIRLDAAGYSLYRTSGNRDDRIKVFESFFGTLNQYRRTLGSELYGQVKENIFVKNARNYNSCLESALDANNIPVSVYHKLIENTNKHLPTLHRYLNLRKRMLGISELHYYDIYPPLVKNVDLKYNYDEGIKLVKSALGVLGNEYVNTVQEAFDKRWIDAYPSTGKKSGAYSSGDVYDEHPYILLNYNGKYDDVSTLAHELGHTMHSYFSNKNQPLPNANYPIFLAEVASTANEALLMDYVLKRINDDEQKLAILGNYLENARATLFRQTQFAEFELRIHELAETGESLTGDRFSEIYLDILRKYYGHKEGVSVIDDLFAIEWAYIPHFYYNFYVFQYSTSFTASEVLAQKMLSGGQEMVDKYLEFLSSGNSDYAIPTLKKAGIDMTTDEPFNIAIAKINRVMDEMEILLKKMKK
ncbi:MAG TPA: oligoendopeptidase F [Cyclobacteriaceae bacterium]|nr:oligoendopeptidase F [Cyclobacteriaceae bacterium]